MSALPPPSAPLPSKTPIDLWGATLIRADFQLSRTPTAPGSGALHRDYTGRWAYTEGSDLLIELPGAHVRQVRVSPTMTVTRERPGWATALGVIGIFFFLIGLIFFFIKIDVQRPGAMVEITMTDGRLLVVQAAGDASMLQYAI